MMYGKVVCAREKLCMVVSRKLLHYNLQQLYSQVYCWAADPLEPELKERNAAEIPTLCIYSLKRFIQN